jgi:hypothetical protein
MYLVNKYPNSLNSLAISSILKVLMRNAFTLLDPETITGPVGDP